jgi:hypothetical protein
MRKNAFLEVISQKDTSWNGVPELFFADIGITNTSSLTKFWVSLCILEPIFLYKNSIVYTYGNVCKTYSILILSICHHMVISL